MKIPVMFKMSYFVILKYGIFYAHVLIFTCYISQFVSRPAYRLLVMFVKYSKVVFQNVPTLKKIVDIKRNIMMCGLRKKIWVTGKMFTLTDTHLTFIRNYISDFLERLLSYIVITFRNEFLLLCGI